MKTSKEHFMNLTISQVSQIYTGKDRCCRCGCKGDYVATSFMVKPRSEVNDKEAKTRLAKAQFLVEHGAELRCEESYYNVSYGNDRAICVYIGEVRQTNLNIEP